MIFIFTKKSKLFFHRDDHYLFCRLNIRQDSEFASGYGYPKTAFKQEPVADPDIQNTFINISRIHTFGKSSTLHNHSFITVVPKVGGAAHLGR